MFSQNRFCLLLCFILAGCVTVQTRNIAPGKLELSYTEPDVPGGDGPAWATAAIKILTAESLKKCPKGYTKVSEKIVPSTLNTTVWQIKCTE